jgi:hypothetical protein
MVPREEMTMMIPEMMMMVTAQRDQKDPREGMMTTIAQAPRELRVPREEMMMTPVTTTMTTTLATTTMMMEAMMAVP